VVRVLAKYSVYSAVSVNMATSTGDKTVNKVALCSAIFAGFAYVGYSVVRTAFCRKLGRRDGEGNSERTFLISGELLS
jgi:hypothetical protein